MIINYFQGEGNSTSYTAHMSGVVMGILVGLTILKNRRVEHWEKYLIVASLLLAALLLIVLVILNVIFAEQMTSNMQKIKCRNFVL